MTASRQEKALRKKIIAEQKAAFSKTRGKWREEILRSGSEGRLALAAAIRDHAVPPNDPARKRLNKMFRDTGVGDHPVYIEFMERLAIRFFRGAR